MPEPQEPDRRGLERRLDHLEREYGKMSQILQRVEIEQANAKEVLKSRFDALYKGQDLLIAKIDGFQAVVNTISGDADNSAAGRQLLRDIKRLDGARLEFDRDMEGLKTFKHEILGALWIVQWVGFGSFFAAVSALVKAFLF